MTTIACAVLCAGLNLHADEAPAHRFGVDGPFVREWLVLGPFPNEKLDTPDADGYTRRGYGTDYLAEVGGESSAALKPRMKIRGPDGKTRETAVLKTDDAEGKLVLDDLLGTPKFKVAYVYTTIRADKAARAHCFIGADDSARVWVNDNEVYRDFNPNGRGLFPRHGYFTAELAPGDNRVLVKIDQVAGGWGIIFESMTAEEVTGPAREKARWRVQPGTPESDGRNRWTIPLDIQMDYHASLFEGVDTELQVLDTKGRAVEKMHPRIGKKIELEVRSGVYEVVCRARMDTGNGSLREMCGQSWFIAHEEPVALIGDVLQRQGHRIEGYPSDEDFGDAFIAWQVFVTEQLEKALAAEQGSADKEVCRRVYQLEQLSSLRKKHPDFTGCVQWAYLSRVDGSAQPFTLRIPDHFKRSRSWPLYIYLHGMGGNHGEAWGDRHPHPRVELNVEGRGRAGGYAGVSEVDVMEAMDFVCAHWPIDRDRIVLRGGSMGGFGSFRLGSRYPDRWAALAPECGGAGGLPLLNLVPVPVFALHSDDDDIVPVSYSRGAVEALNEAGGRAVMAEISGYGHSVGRWQEGIDRMHRWAVDKTRCRSKEMRHIRLTASDEASRSAWWVHVEKFGSEPSWPVVHARLDPDNTLYIDIVNAEWTRLDLEASPANMKQPLDMVIDGGMPIRMDPIPADCWIVKAGDRYVLSGRPPAAPSRRLHYPGGLNALYHGEPLMVVYGTRANEKTTAMMKSFAEKVSRSSNAGITHLEWHWMTYGGYPVKADIEVTAEDQHRFNMILIGTAEQNAIVEEMAAAWPVSLAEGEAVSDDGVVWGMKDCGLGLLHVNPGEPDRLVYWIASESPAFYSAKGTFALSHHYAKRAADFIITHTERSRIIAMRNFTSDWQWAPEYAGSIGLPPTAGTPEGFMDYVGEQLRAHTGADVALVHMWPEGDSMHFDAAQSRVRDYENWLGTRLLSTIELTGKEIDTVDAIVKKEPETYLGSRFYAEEAIDPEQSYTVVLMGWDVAGIGKALGYFPDTFEYVLEK